MHIDLEVDVALDSYFGRLKGVSKSVQVLFNDEEAVKVMVQTLIVLKCEPCQEPPVLLCTCRIRKGAQA